MTDKTVAVDWNEIGRLHALSLNDDVAAFSRRNARELVWDMLYDAFPAILAERSAAENLYDKTATLYDYLLETDEEGLIHHATQMRDVWLAVNKYRNTDEAFDKETQND